MEATFSFSELTEHSTFTVCRLHWHFCRVKWVWSQQSCADTELHNTTLFASFSSYLWYIWTFSVTSGFLVLSCLVASTVSGPDFIFFFSSFWSSGCFLSSLLHPLTVLLSSSPLTLSLCPALCLICIQPSFAALWHLSAIIWSGNAASLSLCFHLSLPSSLCLLCLPLYGWSLLPPLCSCACFSPVCVNYFP